MKCAPPETDFLVVGAGVAGLRAAIELAPAGRVVVLAKREITDSATHYAQGGIAVALSDEDEISIHLQDTLVAGDGLCNVTPPRSWWKKAHNALKNSSNGGRNLTATARLAFTREGAHSRDRILHAHGDSTGREILRALYAKAKTLKNISVCEFEFSTELRTENGRVSGINLIGDKGTQETMLASFCSPPEAWASSTQYDQSLRRHR